MTLTYPALAEARQILWLVTGPTKRGALAKLMAGDESIPAGGVQNDHMIVVADEAAGVAARSAVGAARFAVGVNAPQPGEPVIFAVVERPGGNEDLFDVDPILVRFDFALQMRDRVPGRAASPGMGCRRGRRWVRGVGGTEAALSVSQAANIGRSGMRRREKER